MYIDKVYENQKDKFEDFPNNIYPINKTFLNCLKTYYECGSNFINFLNEFYDIIDKDVISVNDFRTLYYRGINDMIDKSRKEGFELVLILGKGLLMEKSNFWLTMYTYGKFKEMGAHIQYVVRGLYDLIDTMGGRWCECNKIIAKSGKEKVLAIFCDDVVYSGSQAKESFRNFNKTESTVPINNKLYVYMCIVAMTDYGKNSILDGKELSKFMFTPNYKHIKTRHDVFKELSCNYEIPIVFDDCKKIIDNKDMFILTKSKSSNYVIKSLFFSFRFVNNQIKKIYDIDKEYLTFVYTELKYPDSISTYGKLCDVPKFEDYEFLYSKLSEKTKNVIILKFVKSINDAKEEIMIDEEFIKEIFDDIRIGIKAEFPSIETYNDLSPSQLSQIIGPSLISVLEKSNLLRKCRKVIQNISLIKNCEYDSNTCETCPKPFYKHLDYSDSETYINKRTSDLSISFAEWIKKNPALSTGGSYYKKYMKYKRKYLRLKYNFLS
jgi:hypothetical protein